MLDTYKIRTRWAPPPHIAGLCVPSQRILERQVAEDMWRLLNEVDRLNAKVAAARTEVRLEWVQYNEFVYHLVLHIYGVQKNLMLVFATSDDTGWSYVIGGNLIGPVCKDDVILKAKEYVQSVNLPCEVPTFPEVTNA